MNYLDDLLNVGKTKSLGYLPLSTIQQVCGASVEELIRYAESHNLGWVLLSKWRCSIASGALYFYDEPSLTAILNRNHACLSRAGVPTRNIEKYIKYISRVEVYAYKYPEAWAAVHETFTTI